MALRAAADCSAKHTMPNKKLSMSRIKQVLRCYAAGKGTRSIADLLDISRNTVKKYITTFNQSGKTIEEILSMDDLALLNLFKEDPVKNKTQSRRYDDAMSRMPEYARMLRKKSMTKLKVFEQYQEEFPDGYSRSRFYRVLQAYLIQAAPVAHLEHKAGDRMYVDFAGDRLHLVDRETGEKTPVEVFVAILPCSQLTYVEAVMSQKKEDFIHACENAFYFYGGTPQVIVPDNLKAAVTHPNKYESELNEDFAAFAEHYGCTALPARVRRPRDKALVEGAVKLIYRTIYPSLEEKEYYDLEGLNAAIRVALEIHNNANLTGRNYSRREQYEEVERACMGPLNPIRFELKKRAIATVQQNGYVRLEKHYYSVPVELIGKKVHLHYDSRNVYIYYKYECVATHPLGAKPYGYTTNPDHLPKSQQNYLEWDPEILLDQAAAMGEPVKTYLSRVIEARRYPEQAYKSCKGILALGKRVGEERLVKACLLGLVLGNYSYHAIEQILSNRQEDVILDQEETTTDTVPTIPKHKNIRGKEYYS